MQTVHSTDPPKASILGRATARAVPRSGLTVDQRRTPTPAEVLRVLRRCVDVHEIAADKIRRRFPDPGLEAIADAEAAALERGLVDLGALYGAEAA